jgi:putative tricarboxylic transport membrane protein
MEGKVNKKEGVAGLAFFAIGLVGLLVMLRLPVGTLGKPDAAFFPVLLSVLLIILSLVLLGQAFTKARRAHPDRVHLGDHWKRLIPTVLGIVAYVIFFPALGYLASTFLALILFSKLIRSSWRASLLTSFFCTAISYLILRFYLQVPLPQGILPFF